MAKYPIDSAAVSWLDSNGTIHIRVYWTDAYTVLERCWDGNGWSDGSFKQQGSDVSATSWMGPKGISIRVYCTYQDQSTEWCFDTGGSGWYKGAFTIE
jgi:hypothetical protein